MEPNPQSSTGDRSPAHPLEISVALASSVEQVLFRFAEKAELETALVVDHSGALVSGISADDGQDVDVISALAAGASGAIQALVKKLGDSSEVESFHHGSGQVVYLAGVGGRFVLVGVCRGGTSIGAIREEARQVRPSLASLLATLDATQTAAQERPPVETTPEQFQTPPHLADPESRLPVEVPLIESAPETASLPAEASARSGDDVKVEGFATGEDLPPLASESATNPKNWEQSELDAREEAEIENENQDEAGADAETESGSELDSLPTGIVEYLGEEGPEVVIEPSLVLAESVSDSPFEMEEVAGAPIEAGENDERAEEAIGERETESYPAGEEVSAGSTHKSGKVEEFETVEEFVEEDAAAAVEAAPVKEEIRAVDDVEPTQAPTSSPPVETADSPPAPAVAASKTRKNIPEPPQSLFEIDADEDVAFEGEPPALGSSGLLDSGSFDLSAFELDFDELEESASVSFSGEKIQEKRPTPGGLAGRTVDAGDLIEHPFGGGKPFEDVGDTQGFGFEPDSVTPPGSAEAGYEMDEKAGSSREGAPGEVEPDIPPFDLAGDSKTLEDEEEEEQGVSAKGPFYF